MIQAVSKSVESVVIITGFPCLLEYNPPTETDGPIGAMAIALALIRIGKRVTVITDEVNEDVVLSAGAALGATKTSSLTHSSTHGSNSTGPHAIISQLCLESFPGAADFDEGDNSRLLKIAEDCDLVIAIERAGPASDGTYRTMRKIDMSHVIAPLDLLFTAAAESGVSTIGIGDGGNEVGMGKVFEAVLASGIPNAKEIACVTSCEHLIVSSVSNWGNIILCRTLPLLGKLPLYRQRIYNHFVFRRLCPRCCCSSAVRRADDCRFKRKST